MEEEEDRTFRVDFSVGVMEEEDRTFRVDFSVEGVSRLRDVVKGKLKEFMGDYTDDTLVDYVIVLLKNGRRKEEAKNELDVFLGDDSDPFISWLWDHLGANLSSYVKPEDVHTAIEPKGKLVSQDKRVSSVVDAKERNTERNSSQENKIPEKNGNETDVPRSMVDTTIDKKKAHPGSQQERSRRTKESLTRRPIHDSERGQDDEKQQRKRDALPTSVSAPRRLLQFAVRDAVATSRPSLKRLRSVVTRTTEDTQEEERPKRARQLSMSAAIKAVAEAANDVRKARQSHGVFDRIGHDSDFANTPASQAFGFSAEGMVDVDTEMVGMQPRYHVQNEKSGMHYDMLPVHDHSENVQEDFAFDMREREDAGISRLASSGGNWVENSHIFHSSTGTSNEGLRGLHKRLIRPEDLTSNYSRTPHDWDDKCMSELRTANIQSVEHNILTRKSVTPVVALNGDVKPDTIPQISQMAQSRIGSHHTVIQVEYADSRTIFISNVHFGATKDSLSSHFNKCGEILKVIILTDPSTGHPKGSAYIEFTRKDAADLALSLNGTPFMSRILKVVKKTSAQPEATSVVARPPARASPFPVQSLGRVPIPRGISNRYRTRTPLKPGSRSFQWKREPDSNAPDNAAHAPSSTKFPTTRSFTYVRPEQKTNGNSGNA